MCVVQAVKASVVITSVKDNATSSTPGVQVVAASTAGGGGLQPNATMPINSSTSGKKVQLPPEQPTPAANKTSSQQSGAGAIEIYPARGRDFVQTFST